MPFVGLGLHFMLALFCAVHVVRTGQQLYWLVILFTFPLLGSSVYFFVVYLPNSRLERAAFNAVNIAAKAIDPTKDIREARKELEHTPTAQNQMRLASALLHNGEATEAAKLYESCLAGPFAQDPEIKFGAARAFFEAQRYTAATKHLEELHRSSPDFRSESVTLLLARSYAATARPMQASEFFEKAVARHRTFEALAEFEIWALSTRNMSLAAKLQSEIDVHTSRWNRVNRDLNAPVLRRLQAAQELVQS